MTGGKGKIEKGAVTKRHRPAARDVLKGIAKPAIRRMARRGGVKRVAFDAYEKTRESVKAFLTQIVHDAAAITENCQKKTVTTAAIVYALRRNNRPIYGCIRGQ